MHPIPRIILSTTAVVVAIQYTVSWARARSSVQDDWSRHWEEQRQACDAQRRAYYAQMRAQIGQDYSGVVSGNGRGDIHDTPSKVRTFSIGHLLVRTIGVWQKVCGPKPELNPDSGIAG